MEAAIVIDGVEITEAQVCAWMIQRMERIRAAGLPVHRIELVVRRYDDETHTAWGMHAAGECVVSHPSSVSAEAKLREECFVEPELKAREKREQAAALLKEADALQSLARKSQPA